MWLFSKYGFYSVVSAREGDGKLSQPVDPDRVQIRVRVVQHLVNLQEAFPTLAEFEILRTPGADYAARLIVPKSVFVPVWTDIAEGLDYDNFKTEVGRAHLTEASYKERLYSVWGTMNSLQARKREVDWPEAAPSRYFRSPADDFKSRQKRLGFWPASGVANEHESDDREDTEPAAVAPVSFPPTTVDRTHCLADGTAARRRMAQDALNGTDVLLVQRRRGDAPLENVAFLIDVGQYRKGVVAARDAAVLGCFERIPRSQLLFVRGSGAKQQMERMPTVPCFWLTGVEPSRGVQVAHVPGTVDATIQAARPTKETAMTEQKKRVIGADIAAKAQTPNVEFNRAPAPLVEDATMVGGLDAVTGAPVIRPKTPAGGADKMTEATDRREKGTG